MRPLNEFKNPGLKLVLTDVDDTLTEKGRLHADTYAALWRLHDKGLWVVPVTGRPAGWCEMIARTWPVRGVVGENGSFYFCLRDRGPAGKGPAGRGLACRGPAGHKMHRHFAAPEKQRLQQMKKLQQMAQNILQQVPEAAIASDQFCRLMNLAIDYCEDVEPLSQPQVQKIMQIFRAYGVEAHISSIHINAWLNASNKLSMSQQFALNELGLDFKTDLQQVAFIGDSPNDAPSFKKIKNSFGVANIKNFDHLDFTRPQFITQKAYGAGFVEVVDKILHEKNV